MMFWPTALLTGLLFWLGLQAEQRLKPRCARWSFFLVGSLIAFPGFAFAFYYTKLMGEPIWLYEFRAARGTELSAAGLGLIAGFVHGARGRHTLLKRQLRSYSVPVLCALVVAAPYLKPVLFPLDTRELQPRWQNDVCMQSTASSCGPASAATVARIVGKKVEEEELALECFTYRGGTENWYLARALKRRGLSVRFVKSLGDATELPFPAIAGVRLSHGAGHFIAILGKEDGSYVLGDPLVGREVMSLEEFRASYNPTGFCLLVQ